MTPSVLLLLCLSPLLLALETRALPTGEQSGGKPVDLVGELRTAREAARHGIARKKDGRFTAFNPGQRWQTEFDASGFTVKPDHAAWTWGLELAGGSRGVIESHDGTLVHRRDRRITEWFVNDHRGLQQGWSVGERPGKGVLRLPLSIRGGLKPSIDPDGRGVVFKDAGGLEKVTYRGLKAWDADGVDLRASFSLAGADRLLLTVDDKAARYPVTIDPIAQLAYAKASNTGNDDAFGSAVAVSGNTVVVGAPLESSNATGVNGNGFNNYASQSGAAYVFVRSGEAWVQQAYLKPSNTGAGDHFGWSVAISGDTIVVGAYQEDGNATGVNGNASNNSASSAGAAYVFSRNGSTWSQQAYLKASNTGAGDLFGASVAMDGDTVVVGANREASQATGIDGDGTVNGAYAAGAAYVFARQGSVWTQQAYVKASDTSAGAEFGSALGLSGDSLIVGAPLTAGGAGAAYVFIRNGATWSQQAKLEASSGSLPSGFGQAVAISGNLAVAGAPGEASNATGVNGNSANTSAPDAGAAYLFARSGTSWTQQAYVKASNTEAGDGFGRAVALDGNALLVGAAGEDSAASGIGGNQADNGAASSGAAYVFGRIGSEWSQHAYLKASNTGGGDEFGKTLALSGNTAVVGAARESSHATGIQGMQASNLSSWSGAAYLFEIPAFGVPDIGIWHEAVELANGGSGVTFPPAATGANVTCTVRIRNAGTEPLSPGLPWLEGVDAERFSVQASGLPAELAGGQEGAFTVTFTAPAIGSYQAMLQVPSNDGDESPFAIGLSATAMSASDLYAAWAAGEGLSGADAAASANPFHDGVANLLKYAFNLEGDRADVRTLVPSSGTAGLPGFRLVGSGSQAVLRAEFLRRVGSGLVYTPKVSTTLDPGTFTPMTGTTTVTAIDSQWERVVVDEPRDPSESPRVFGVLEVTLP